jgi:hypothetical protein
MGKFKKIYEYDKGNEYVWYVCPVCERRYNQYTSLWSHYKLKHGNRVNSDSDNDTTEKKMKMLRLHGGVSSDSGKDRAERDRRLAKKMKDLRLYG